MVFFIGPINETRQALFSVVDYGSLSGDIVGEGLVVFSSSSTVSGSIIEVS